MRHLPPFSSMRAFEAAARRMSFTKAAEELGISQSAVSHQVRQLEDYLDTGLFIRSPRGLGLTRAGTLYRDSLSVLLDELDAATKNVTEDSDGVLHVKATPTFAARWLTPRMDRFQNRHGVSLVIASGMPPTDFSRGEHDVEIHWGSAPIEGVVIEPFMATPKIAVCDQATARRLRETGPEGLRNETLLRDETDDCWREWLEGAGVSGVDHNRGPAFAYCDLGITAAERGQGVALSYRALIEDDLAEGRLVQVFPHETVDKVIYSVAYLRSRRFSRKIIDFRDWIFEEIAGVTTNGAEAQKALRVVGGLG